MVFGRVAGEQAAQFARSAQPAKRAVLTAHAAEAASRILALLASDKSERVAVLRDELGDCMEEGVGIYRTESGMQQASAKLAELRARYRRGVKLDDHSRAFNTEWLCAIELGFMLDVAEAMAHAALARRESRGAHVRLDAYNERDDAHYLHHSLAFYGGDGPPRIGTAPVVITKSPPRTRSYGGAGKQAVLT